MSRNAISAFLVTLNEADHIAAVIESLRCFDEVVVVESGSTDGTADIARGLGAQVHHREWLGYAQQKALAAELCSNDWLLNVDGDEVVTGLLAGELLALAQRDDIAAVKIPVNDFILGAPLHGLSRKRKIVRMFRRGMAKYPINRTVHENLVVEGSIAVASSELHHFGYDDPNVFFSKQIKYAQLRAADKLQNGTRGSLIRLLFIAPFTFGKVFVLRGLFFSGYRGLIVAAAESWYAFLKEVNLIRARSSSEPHE